MKNGVSLALMWIPYSELNGGSLNVTSQETIKIVTHITYNATCYSLCSCLKLSIPKNVVCAGPLLGTCFNGTNFHGIETCAVLKKIRTWDFRK